MLAAWWRLRAISCSILAFADAASEALKAGAPVFCNSQMVANGITRARLPANNEIICTLSHPEVPALAAKLSNTRSAAASNSGARG